MFGAQAVYAGDVTAKEAWEMLKADPGAMLVDVRTRAEWSFVGIPALGDLGREPLLVEWQVFPTMAINPYFAEQVAGQAMAADAGKERTILMLCRSGARSRSAAAALTQQGFSRCFNISDGFEGNRDSHGHRGTMEGWKASGLPWVQS